MGRVSEGGIQLYHSTNQRDFARNLRKNMSDAEVKLWSLVRAKQLRGFKFRRQAAIGKFIVDFVCFPSRLVVELDGSQHGEPENVKKDLARTTWLESQGYRVLRFWNHDVLENPDGVIDTIWNQLESSNLPESPLPSPPHQGEGV